MITQEKIADYYDWLSRYVQFPNWLSYRDRFASFTMHKPLSVPGEAESDRGREAGLHYVNNRLLETAQFPPAPRVLDAGCGFGGTIFHWRDRISGTYDGLTLSRVQLRIAQREARRRGIDGVCRFHLRSYDAPIAESYNAVVAIESLVHSPDLNRTIANLASSLRPTGLMLIVDDMAEVDLDSETPSEASLLRIHCGYTRYPMQKDYQQALARARLTVIHEEDLTAQVQPRSPALLKKLDRAYGLLYKTIRLNSVRTLLSTYIGGLALERLYLAGKICYRLIVARKEE